MVLCNFCMHVVGLFVACLFLKLKAIHYHNSLMCHVVCACADIVQSGPPEAAMLQYVMHLLAVEDIEGLPPGGGINAK